MPKSKSSISIKDVAAHAGVSTATVSNVFSGAKPVNAALAEKVRKTANDLGYQVNRAASMLRSGRNKIVAVVVPDLAGPFFTSLIREIEQLAKLDDFEIIVANSDNDVEKEHTRLEALLSWQPAGLIMVPCTDVLPDRLLTRIEGTAVVLADRVANKFVADCIMIDNADAGRIAAKYLCEIGHKSILLAASDCTIEPIRERVRGAENAVKALLGKSSVVEVGSRPEEGAARLGKWMDRNTHPTAIIALSDMATLSVLFCLAERRVEVGTGMSVVGFDDYPWMLARRTPITAVQQPVADLAKTIWYRLKLRMEGDTSPAQAIELECTLKIRESSKEYNGGPPKPLAGLEDSELSQGTNTNAKNTIGRKPVH
jgi:LacI family transcriptional regulator